MSRGKTYLDRVSILIKNKIQELNSDIQEAEKDIDSMHEYYWENYTEMDQYGYENFDNRQALLTQVNASTESIRKRAKLRKMLDAPFFGSVDFLYEGDETPEVFYIGIANFAREAGQVPLIYDWRAPVSGLFYDFDKGAASYEAPCGTMEGTILSKWQYKIRSGRLIYEFESDTKIDDDILKQELGASSDVQLKNIVRTIQKEQNAIIRNTKDKILVIQGAAGSGKTSIALHRIAYLLYHDREHLKSSNILILSPNSVFSDYISHILPELGEENIQEMSFDLYAYRRLQDVVHDCEDRSDAFERHLADRKSLHYDWKQSKDFVREMDGFLIELEDRLVEFRDIEYGGCHMSTEELIHLFYDRFPEKPLLARAEEVMDVFVDRYETLNDRDLRTDELEMLKEQFLSLYVTRDIYRIYNWFLEDHDLPVLPDVPLEERFLEYEDVYPLLYLKYRLYRPVSARMIRHLVIDEMQDYSYLQYVILRILFDCRMTILGDRAQTVAEKPQDVLTFLPKILGKDLKKIEIRKSYRNTVEIAKYAESMSGVTEIEYLERHGKPVMIETRPSMEDAMQAVLANVRSAGDVYETAAVLTMTVQEAKQCAAILKKNAENVQYIDRDSTSFKRGITVTTFYQAKGLEFDQVFLVGGDPENAFYKQYQYIGATRALHELYVYQLD